MSRHLYVFLFLPLLLPTAVVSLRGQEIEQLPSLANPSEIVQPQRPPAVRKVDELPSVIDGTPLAIEPTGIGCGCCDQCGEVSPCSCQSCGKLDACLPYVFTARWGLDNFSVDGDARTGTLYGADVAYHLSGEWGCWGGLNVSHFSAGSQLLGSFGLVKIPNLCGCHATSPYMFAVLFDQFKDSRVDGLYLNRLRMQAGYTFVSGLELGLVYTESLSEDDNVNFIIRNSGTNVQGTVRHAQHFSFYAGGKLGAVNWTSVMGYSDETDEFSLGTVLRTPVSCNVGSYASVHYGTDSGSWIGTIGFEVQFGKKQHSTTSCSDGCVSLAQSDETIVRGQDSGGYFSSPAGNQGDNVLWGDYFYVAGARGFSQSFGSTHLDVLGMYSTPSSFWGEVYVASLQDPLAFGLDTVIEGTRRQANW